MKKYITTHTPTAPIHKPWRRLAPDRPLSSVTDRRLLSSSWIRPLWSRTSPTAAPPGTIVAVATSKPHRLSPPRQIQAWIWRHFHRHHLYQPPLLPLPCATPSAPPATPPPPNAASRHGLRPLQETAPPTSALGSARVGNRRSESCEPRCRRPGETLALPAPRSSGGEARGEGGRLQRRLGLSPPSRGGDTGEKKDGLDRDMLTMLCL